MEFNATFLASIVSFVVFVFLMNKLLYAPVRKVVHQRADLINGNYAAADENDKKSEEITAECDEKLSGAKEDARTKYNELLDGYKEQRTDIIKEAQDNSQNELNDAYANLERVSNEAKESLKGRMTDLANDIVEKVLGYRSEVRGFDNDSVNDILYRERGRQ